MSKQIDLSTNSYTENMSFQIDKEDYELVKNKKWYVAKDKQLHYSIRTDSGKTKLARLIMSASRGEIVDHIDGNIFNNKKENLRICSQRDNSKNRAAQRTNKYSKYKGVTFYKRNNKWGAIIISDGKRIFLGLHETEKEAAIAYNVAAIKYHKEYARLNYVR